ncbi:MAG: BlaI/MecI/CopY family transcriptional regulator [Alistipes sp.]|nr:BlaI/MecI/CopY family transcriptional regulator [Alistipes sp.]
MATDKSNRPQLTKGEEEVMQVLWELDKGTVNDIIARMPDPKPKYTTVATFIKILENKEFVRHEAVGKGFVYYPAVAKEEYARTVVGNLLASYFDGSMSNMVSFFSRQEKISMRELDEIMEIVEKARKS